MRPSDCMQQAVITMFDSKSIHKANNVLAYYVYVMSLFLSSFLILHHCTEEFPGKITMSHKSFSSKDLFFWII